MPSISFKVRGQLLSHGVAYGLIGPGEENPTSLAMACLRHFQFRSFWDVGANFGYYSWLLKSAAPELEIVLVEPLPINARLIHDTVRRNRFSNVELIEAAASNKPGSGTLYADMLAGLTSSLIKGETFEQHHFGIASKAIDVSLTSIDALRRERSPVDFIKIDVEGHEAAVLRGAKETIELDQPVLFIECSHPDHGCLAPLESSGYVIVDADRMSLDCSQLSYNFFCFPNRHVDSIGTILSKSALVQSTHL